MNNESGITESELIQSNENMLDEAKAELDSKEFVPLAYGDEWRVYVPLTSDQGEKVSETYEAVMGVDDAFDPSFREKARALDVAIKERIGQEQIPPEVVLKVSREKLGEDTHIMTEDELNKELERRTQTFDLLNEYLGEYITPSLFWIGEQPKHLPEPSTWEKAPQTRQSLMAAEAEATHNKALMCLQPYEKGPSLEEWKEQGHQITPEIQDLFERTVSMVKETGKMLDPASFARDNIIINEGGTPRIVDATVVIDPNKKNFSQAVGKESLEDLDWEDLLKL